MSIEKSRSKEQIFADMHRELRRWNPAIPESVDRLDSILRILLELYAHQLERIDKRIDRTWEVAVSSLIRSVVPESKKWPVPAFAVMRCRSADPVVEIDPHTRFFYKEKREGGQTFFFSSQKTEKLISAEVKHVFVRFQDIVLDVSPGGKGDTAAANLPTELPSARGRGQVYVAVDYEGMPSNFADTVLYLNGPDTVLRQLRWAYWYPGSHSGEFYEDSAFCPGLVTDIERLFSADSEPVNWGGLRRSSDLFKPIENGFVFLPETFTATWEIGPIDPSLDEALRQSGREFAGDSGRFYWIRADLPPGGDKKQLKSGFDLFFNCFVVTNKNELSTYKYTGGNRLVEVELPEAIDTILEITSVTDSNRNDYAPQHKVQERRAQYRYTLEERNDHLVLWFDYSTQIEAPPDYITVNYSVTTGTAANGIAAGQIRELYEKHPGVLSAENVSATRGAIPAKTDQQILAEVSLRLRNRDRVLSFQEIAGWTRAFDPRIKDAHCENIIERGERGIRRCLLVRVTVGNEDFYSDDETSLLRIRLIEFLKARSPVNTNYQVEIVRV